MPEAHQTHESYVSATGRDSRRWGIGVVAVAIVVVGAAVAALGLVTVGSGGDLPRLTIGAGGAGERADAAAMSMVPTRFELADGVEVPAGQGPAWRWSAPTADEVTALAARLGLSGTPEQIPSPGDAGGGWVLDGLSVSATGGWSFSDGTAVVSICDDVTVTPGAVVDGDTPVASDSVDPDRSAPQVEPARPDVWCEPVDPPAEVPSTDEVLATAERITGPGVEASYTVVASDPWGVTVEVAYLVDGQPSGLTGIVSASELGLFAFGYLGRPEPVGNYPTVSASQAVGRLADPGRWTGVLAPTPVPTAAVAVDDTVVTGVTPDDVVVAEPLPATDVPVDDVIGPEPVPVPEPVIEPAPVIEPVDPVVGPEPPEAVVVLVDVAAIQVGFVDAGFVPWSVPGYRFTDEQGQNWEVVAVTDEYFDVVDDAADVPAEPPVDGGGVDGGSGSSPGSPGDGGVVEPYPGDGSEPALPFPDVVGLAEDDAVAVLTRAGFATVRVVARDGESFMVTRDLRYDRANLVIDGGVVTSAYPG